MVAFLSAVYQCQYGIFVLWLIGSLVAGLGMYLLVLVLIPVAGIIRARDTMATHAAIDKFVGIKRSGFVRDAHVVRTAVAEVEIGKGHYTRLFTTRGFLEMFLLGIVLWTGVVIFSGASFCQ